jgi:carnitine 3-dehydrogenase
MYTAESHLIHKSEARAPERLYVTTRVLEVDDKRVRLAHSLHRTRDDVLAASAEQLYLHVNTAAGKAAPMEQSVRTRLTELQAAAR